MGRPPNGRPRMQEHHMKMNNHSTVGKGTNSAREIRQRLAVGKGSAKQQPHLGWGRRVRPQNYPPQTPKKQMRKNLTKRSKKKVQKRGRKNKGKRQKKRAKMEAKTGERN